MKNLYMTTNYSELLVEYENENMKFNVLVLGRFMLASKQVGIRCEVVCFCNFPN